MKEEEIKELNSKGPEAIYLEMAQGKFGAPGSPARVEVESWLQSKAFKREDFRDELTIEANRLASEANRAASLAARWAKIAAIIAAITMISSHIALIRSAISWVLKLSSFW